MSTELHILLFEESNEHIVVAEEWDVTDGCLWFVCEGKRTATPLHNINHFWMPLPPKERDPWEVGG